MISESPSAFRVCECPPPVLAEALGRAAPDIADEVFRGGLEMDTVLAAVDSALVTNPQTLKILSDLRAESCRDPDAPPPPFPLLEDYTSDAASPSRASLRKVLRSFRDHFDLESHLASRAFRQVLGGLRRALGPTESALIKAAARAWWEDSPGNSRWKVQGGLIHTPETVVGIALGEELQARTGRRPVLAIYNTAESGKLLRLLVAKEAELMAAESDAGGYRQASVVAAPSLPNVFASLRFRRRAYFLVSEAPSDIVARAATAAVAELTSRRTARRERVGRESASARGKAFRERLSNRTVSTEPRSACIKRESDSFRGAGPARSSRTSVADSVSSWRDGAAKDFVQSEKTSSSASRRSGRSFHSAVTHRSRTAGKGGAGAGD